MNAAIDYNNYHGLGNVNIKNVSLVNKCQGCGGDCEDTLCPSCKGRKVFDISIGERKFDRNPQKHVTVRGCEVFVNGKIEGRRGSFFEANTLAEALKKRYARENLARGTKRAHL